MYTKVMIVIVVLQQLVCHSGFKYTLFSSPFQKKLGKMKPFWKSSYVVKWFRWVFLMHQNPPEKAFFHGSELPIGNMCKLFFKQPRGSIRLLDLSTCS